uniref:Uncharacterized protein n=1 Tax=Desertifilum tharense IPPAS B-1220 TaxID=1781255 RepID=A0ACD5H0G4_9CYAN
MRELKTFMLESDSTYTYAYKVGGHLPLDSPSYVVRQADRDLYQGFKGGRVLLRPQLSPNGKNELARAYHASTASGGVACAAIDLTKIGSQDITPDQWYAGVMRRLVTSFKLDLNLRAWLCDREFLPPFNASAN